MWHPVFIGRNHLMHIVKVQREKSEAHASCKRDDLANCIKLDLFYDGAFHSTLTNFNEDSPNVCE